jgi:hypothetical protein
VIVPGAVCAVPRVTIPVGWIARRHTDPLAIRIHLKVPAANAGLRVPHVIPRRAHGGHRLPRAVGSIPCIATVRPLGLERNPFADAGIPGIALVRRRVERSWAVQLALTRLPIQRIIIWAGGS